MPKLNRDNMQEFVCEIIEHFEDFLDAKGIELDNPEKQEAKDAGEDPESICNIYGSDYGRLQSECEELLDYWNLVPRNLIFKTFLIDDDIRMLTAKEAYDGNKERFETRRGLAILEMGYMDIELNICLSEDDGKLEPAYFICKKCRDDDDPNGTWEYWENVGYADEILPSDVCTPNIDWSVDYGHQLRYDMERVLKLYAEKAGLYFDKPNKSVTNLKSWTI